MLSMKYSNFLFRYFKFCIIFLLYTSCKNKPELKLLFSTSLTMYSNDENSNKKYDTQIAISDSFFLIQSFTAGHSENFSPPTVNLWENGKEKKEIASFDSLIKKYDLKIIPFNQFVEYVSNFSEKNKSDTQGLVHNFSENLGLRKTSKICFNGDSINFIDSASSKKNELQFDTKNKRNVFLLDKKTSTTQMIGSYMKLYNIANDKKEEIFILTPEFNYRGLGWFLEVYQLQD